MKRSFMLMEVLIGFSLAALILGMLFTSLYETSLANSRLEKAERDVLGRAEFQQRLDAIFGNLIPLQQGKPLYLIQSDPPTLCLEFQSGIDPDPCFSDRATGFLELKGQDLCFRVIGNTLLEKNPPKEREEKLKVGVTKIVYEFLNEGKVYPTWEENLPDYLKLTLFFGKNKKEEYVFWIKKEVEGILIE